MELCTCLSISYQRRLLLASYYQSVLCLMSSSLASILSLFILSFACCSTFTGVQDAKGNYIVGGHLGKHQTKLAAGTVIHYRRKIYKKRKGSRDTISIVEPTHEVLKVVVSVELFRKNYKLNIN